jgi:hypothetical protein
MATFERVGQREVAQLSELVREHLCTVVTAANVARPPIATRHPCGVPAMALSMERIDMGMAQSVQTKLQLPDDDEPDYDTSLKEWARDLVMLVESIYSNLVAGAAPAGYFSVVLATHLALCEPYTLRISSTRTRCLPRPFRAAYASSSGCRWCGA